MDDMILITPQPLTEKPWQLGNLVGTRRWFAESLEYRRNPKRARVMFFSWTAPSVDMEPQKIDGRWYWVPRTRDT